MGRLTRPDLDVRTHPDWLLDDGGDRELAPRAPPFEHRDVTRSPTPTPRRFARCPDKTTPSGRKRRSARGPSR